MKLIRTDGRFAIYEETICAAIFITTLHHIYLDGKNVFTTKYGIETIDRELEFQKSFTAE